MNWFKSFWEELKRPLSKPKQKAIAPDNLTPRARQVLVLARKEADRLSHNFVGTEHLLLGIIRLGQGIAVNTLYRLGVDLQALREEVEKQVGIGPGQKIVGNIPYTPRGEEGARSFATRSVVIASHIRGGRTHPAWSDPRGRWRGGAGIAEPRH